MKPIKIADGIDWVGALDPQLRVFDIIMKAEHGTTYNSYLVRGNEKTALIDAVKENYTEQFLDNIASLVDTNNLDYIVVNHTEPDHTGSLEKLLEVAPNAQVVISKTCGHFLGNILNRDIAPMKMGDGDSIDLGGKHLDFIHAPFLHWPDTMFTYLREDNILFSCDVFGSHYCDDRLFNDCIDDFNDAFGYYYNTIMRPFKEHILSAVHKLSDLDISMICPSHGPVLRENARYYIDMYESWSQPPDTSYGKNLLVLYTSIYGNTAKIAAGIADGAKIEGINVALFDIIDLDMDVALDMIEDADAMVVGSPTINGDAVEPVWKLLSGLATINLKGKVGAAFGSYGWSGEAPVMIAERLKSLKLKVNEPPLKFVLVPVDDDLAECREFGKRIAQSIV